MKLVYKIVADCSPPPDSYDPLADADLLDELEDSVALALIDAGVSFAIEATVTVAL